MSIDKSLRIRRGAVANRSVYTRAERLQKLMEQERWNEGDPPFGLPKVTLKKKKKAKGPQKGEEEESK